MKKIIVLSLALLLFSFSAKSQFVGVVADPGHIAATITNGGALKKVNNTLKDINEYSQKIRGTVDEIRSLQKNIDNALWQVKNIFNSDHFYFTSLEQEKAFAALLPNDFGYYTEGLNIGNVNKLLEGYNNELVTVGSNILHDAFDYPLDEALPTDFATMLNLVQDRQQNRSAYRVMADRKALQIALTYNQLADVMLAKGAQLNEMLKRGTNNGASKGEALKMTEGERLQLMEVAASNVRKALELKLKCDEIIRQRAENQDPAISIGVDRYSKYLRIKNLAGE